MMKHELHSHPRMEMRLGLIDKVVVDEEFKHLFSSYETLDIAHILVSKQEFEKVFYGTHNISPDTSI